MKLSIKTPGKLKQLISYITHSRLLHSSFCVKMDTVYEELDTEFPLFFFFFWHFATAVYTGLDSKCTTFLFNTLQHGMLFVNLLLKKSRLPIVFYGDPLCVKLKLILQ